MYMYTVHVDASVTRRVIVVYTCEAEMLVCKFLYQSVMLLNELSFVSTTVDPHHNLVSQRAV